MPARTLSAKRSSRSQSAQHQNQAVLYVRVSSKDQEKKASAFRPNFVFCASMPPTTVS